jgi:NTE family protein
VIVPELQEIGASDFDKLLEGVDVGEQAARRMLSELREFSVSEEEFESYLRRQRTTPKDQRPAVTVDSVEVLGLTRTNPGFIERRLQSQPGQPLSDEGIFADLERVHQLGEFENVDVRLVKEEDQTRLLFDAQEKSWGPYYLRFGLGAETNFDGDSEFRTIANFRRPHINRRGGEWKTVAALGDPFSIKTEFFQPLDLGGIHWFVAPSLSFNRDKDERFLPGGALEVVEQETSWVGVDVGVQFRNWGEIRVGARRGTFAGEPTTTSTLEDFDLATGGWKAKATLDQLDNVFFPTAGSFIEIDAFLSRDTLGADYSYDKLSISALAAWGGQRDTLLGSFRVGTDLGSDIPFYDEFQLGGFLNLSGLSRGELQGDVSALATLGYYRRVLDLGALGRGFYVGAFAQTGEAWQDSEEIELGDLTYSGTIFAGLDTLLAPIYLGWGLAEGGSDEFYLFIGKPF